MSRRGARRAGVWLSIYAWGGSLAGVLGFGLLWKGCSTLAWPEAAMGLGFLLLGLDRAATALAISLHSRRAVAARRAGAEGTGHRGAPLEGAPVRPTGAGR